MSWWGSRAILELRKLRRRLLAHHLCELKLEEKQADKLNDKLMTKLRLYHDSACHQSSLLQWYRMLFIAFETILFTIAIALIKQGWPLLLVFIPGLLVCVFWWFTCTQRGNLIDKQKGEVKALLGMDKKQQCERNTELEPARILFRIYESRPEKGLPRFVFNTVLPVLAAGFWLWIVIAHWTVPA